MLKRCRNQLRAGFGGAYGLDFSAVLAVAEGMGASSPLLLDLLPEVEIILVQATRPDEDGGEDEGE